MSKMNSAIVASYGFTGKYNGLIMATSKVTAVGLSAFCIVTGMVNLALTPPAGEVAKAAASPDYAAAVEYGIAGVFLAVLIEGITLICLSLIRGQYLKMRRSTDEEEKATCWRLIHWMIPFGVFGIVLSASAGDLFWFKLLESKPLWEAILLSIAFALVVSFCFLLGELFAVLIELDMVEGMNKGQTMRAAAFAAEHADTKLMLMRESYHELLNDKTERDAVKHDLKAKFKTGLLAEVAQVNIENIVGSNHQLPAGPNTDQLLLTEGTEKQDVKPTDTQALNEETQPLNEEPSTSEDVKPIDTQELEEETQPLNEEPDPSEDVKHTDPRITRISLINQDRATLVEQEYYAMLNAGLKPTQTAIGKRLGLTRQTVAPHFNAIVATQELN